MAITANITTGMSSQDVYDYIAKDKSITLLINVYLPDIIHSKLAKIFVNGIWIGCTSDQIFLVRERYIQCRRDGRLHYHTTVCVDII